MALTYLYKAHMRSKYLSSSSATHHLPLELATSLDQSLDQLHLSAAAAGQRAASIGVQNSRVAPPRRAPYYQSSMSPGDGQPKHGATGVFLGADGSAPPSSEDYDAREQLACWLETAMHGYLQPCLRVPAEESPWLPAAVDPQALPRGFSFAP